MRERHNIVGSEVGHARPPIYFRAGLPRRQRRRGGGRLLAALIVILAMVGAALVWLEGVGGDGLRPGGVWPVQESAGVEAVRLHAG